MDLRSDSAMKSVEQRVEGFIHGLGREFGVSAFGDAIFEDI